MCGIIGFTGYGDVKDVLLSGLQLLEYRGYDSAGIALSNLERKETSVYKCAGRVADLINLVDKLQTKDGCGMGHTRWATHGGVTDENAHPHKYGKITLIHNGIIENYQDLIKQYELNGTLVSQTDSEVVAAILDHYYDEEPFDAIKKTVKELKGTFAFGIIFENLPDKIYAVRNVSPIIATHCGQGSFLASDATALGVYTDRYFVVPEYHIVELSRENAKLYTLDAVEIEPEYLVMDWDISRAGKKGYPFFMEKEILEQPKAIEDTIAPRITDSLPDFLTEGIPDRVFEQCNQVCIIGCGTAMHAGLVGKSLMQSMLGIQVNVEIASEFIYSKPVIDQNTLVIAISQSGETIDTLEALKIARRKGARNISVLNVKGSTLARDSEFVVFTNAGPEIAVASTKAYTTQVAALYLLTCRMALVKEKITKDQARSFVGELVKIPNVLEAVISDRDKIHHIAKSIVCAKDLFMIGRGLDYATILEGSLKLKEITYIHSEAYSSGELKHGAIALIDKNTPVVALVTQSDLMRKELSNVTEVHSRGAYVIMFIKDGFRLENEEQWKVIYRLPCLSDEFMIFPATLVLQLLAYYTSLDKGLDVDKPRNLAKVVTVE